MRKYVIPNSNPKKENICIFKNIFFLKFENPRWQIKPIVASRKEIKRLNYHNFMKIGRISELKASLI